MTDRRCASTLPVNGVKLRCWHQARHDKNVWHQAADGRTKARWNDAGSYEIETQTEQAAA
jgi:hypothetical protein